MEQELGHPEPIKPNCFDETTFAIEIQSVKTIDVGNYQNVVKSISWALIATHNQKNYGLEKVTEFQDEELQSLQNFVPYENLAKQIVIDWIEAKSPMLHLKYSLCNQIDATQSSNFAQPPLPWSN